MEGSKHDCDRRMRPRPIRAVLAAGAALFALSAAAPPARAADAIKVGVLLPLSGVYAVLGQQVLAGMKIYFDSIGNKAGGHPITLDVEDAEGRPDVAVTKARKLVERDGAQILTGVVSSGVALAVNDYARGVKVPLVLSGDAGEDQLTMPGPLANPDLVRITQNGRTVSAAGADYTFKKGWHKVATIAADYAGGVDTMFEFARSFCQDGGKVIQAQWVPTNTADFGPYLTNVDRSADAVVLFEPGADGLRMARQYSQFGLKLPVMDIFGTVVYEPNLPQVGNAVQGFYSSLYYTPELKTPENEKFVAEFKKRTGSFPANEGPNGWVGAHAIADALDAVHGDVKDTAKFIAALRAVKFDSPKGPIELDKRGMVIQTMYIRQVQKVDGGFGNVPVASYKHVDQYWPYTEAQYLSFKYDYKTGKQDMTDCSKLLAKK
ncbi:MAG: ABC transporter substrate-binding protein [Stellaceae bacterium]